MSLTIKDGTGTTQTLDTVTGSSGNLGVSHSTEGTKLTYSSGVTGLVAAASCTDLWVLTGSATKTIRLLRMSISGTATTLITIPIYLCRRATADTGGTPAASLALPVPNAHDSNDAAATATMNAYTANPTINDASPKLIRSTNMTLGTVAAMTVVAPVIWDFTNRNGKAPVLRGIAQQYCLNFSTTSPAATLINIDCEFTEE